MNSKNSLNTTSVFKVLIGVIAVLCVSALVVIVTRPLNTKRIVTAVDTRMNNFYEDYAIRSYGEVTNSLATYIQFLEKHKTLISRDRDVNVLLYAAQLRFGYMLLFSGNEIAACEQMNLAYAQHKLIKARVREKPMARSEFVDYVIAAIEKLDTESKVAWKSQHTLDTNIVSKLNARFAADSTKYVD